MVSTRRLWEERIFYALLISSIVCIVGLLIFHKIYCDDDVIDESFYIPIDTILHHTQPQLYVSDIRARKRRVRDAMRTGDTGAQPSRDALIRPSESAHQLPPPKSASTDSYGERRCRQIMEETFGKPFPKSRPALLQNPVTGHVLELDCYNEELRIAVEFQGRQHYEYTPHFHKSKEDFRTQQYRDHIKKELCAKAGISLILVAYTVPDNKLRKYLEAEIEKLGFELGDEE